VIVSALHGLKSSGADWRRCLAEVTGYARQITTCDLGRHRDQMVTCIRDVYLFTLTIFYVCHAFQQQQSVIWTVQWALQGCVWGQPSASVSLVVMNVDTDQYIAEAVKVLQPGWRGKD
jgi:hypothetical protein